MGMRLSSALGSRTECRPPLVCAETTCAQERATRKEQADTRELTWGWDGSRSTGQSGKTSQFTGVSGSPDASLRNRAKFAAHKRTHDAGIPPKITTHGKKQESRIYTRIKANQWKVKGRRPRQQN